MRAPTPYRGSAGVRRRLPVVLAAAGVVLAAALVALFVLRPWERPAETEDPAFTAQPAPTDSAPVESGPGESADPADSAGPVPTQPTGTDPAESGAESKGPEPYDFTQPVPESEPAAEGYYDDAVFVGDSRTAGFLLYSGVPGGDGLTHTGLSVFQIRDDKRCVTVGGQDYSVLEALGLKQYGKVYLCVGVNELGYPSDESFYEALSQVVADIRAAQPGAVVYLQTLIPLNEDVVKATGGKDYLKNDRLRRYNELIRQVGEEQQVPVLDVYSAFADENGSLPADASTDGVHLKSAGYRQWLEYLNTHTADYADLYPEGETSAPAAG